MKERSVAVSVVGVVALIVVWVGQATWLSHVMDGRGFHRLPWFAVLILLGPAMWPLAVVELISGPPGPVLLRRGNPRDGRLDIFVALDRNDVPKATAAQLRRLAPNCRRVVLGRVIKAGGPTYIRADAERFLSDTAERLGIRGAELQLHYGNVERVVKEIQDRGDFSLVLRVDQPSELFDGDGSRQEMRWQRGVPVA
jgi:hypothetical protein